MDINGVGTMKFVTKKPGNETVAVMSNMILKLKKCFLNPS